MPGGFSTLRIMFCVILGAVFLRIVTGAVRRFKPSTPGERPRPALLLFPLVPILLFYQALRVPLSMGPVVAGSLGLLASLALFEWSVRATGTVFFSWAMSRDTPQVLFEGGPYAYVRNPFYSSYLLAYVSAAVALQTVTSLIIVAVMVFLFWNVARFEERKFAESPVAEQYAAYRQRAGRFLPRLRRLMSLRRL